MGSLTGMYSARLVCAAWVLGDRSRIDEAFLWVSRGGLGDRGLAGDDGPVDRERLEARRGAKEGI